MEVGGWRLEVGRRLGKRGGGWGVKHETPRLSRGGQEEFGGRGVWGHHRIDAILRLMEAHAYTPLTHT